MVFRNNADLGKGVPRKQARSEAWEPLFFIGLMLPGEVAVCVFSYISPQLLKPPTQHMLEQSLPSAVGVGMHACA